MMELIQNQTCNQDLSAFDLGSHLAIGQNYSWQNYPIFTVPKSPVFTCMDEV